MDEWMDGPLGVLGVRRAPDALEYRQLRFMRRYTGRWMDAAPWIAEAVCRCVGAIGGKTGKDDRGRRSSRCANECMSDAGGSREVTSRSIANSKNELERGA